MFGAEWPFLFWMVLNNSTLAPNWLPPLSKTSHLHLILLILSKKHLANICVTLSVLFENLPHNRFFCYTFCLPSTYSSSDNSRRGDFPSHNFLSYSPSLWLVKGLTPLAVRIEPKQWEAFFRGRDGPEQDKRK